MTALAALLTTIAIAPAGVFSGSSAMAPEVSVTVQSGRVVSASAWTSVFKCELGGNVGPASVSVRTSARIASNGYVSFSAGRRSRKLSARLRYRKGRISGRIRVSGTIGGPCASPSIPVSLRRR
ncbi:MAG: hypothetical protein F2799_01335 [Actinobacteria bacterium]|uniref:Unannotated protein n=1 Tax=freshwater metagenome TaxID=449393 RepID=A0A6J7CXP0_9ZZZZ|nr:hypothetical protein [Actinomycetota bacterium]